MDRSYKCNFALDQKRICNKILVIPDEVVNEFKRNGVKLTDTQCLTEDPRHEVDERIHILIGADVSGKLLTSKVRKLSNGLVAVGTFLGWTVMGSASQITNTTNLQISMFVQNEDIMDVCRSDGIIITDPIETQNKEDASNHDFRQEEFKHSERFKESSTENNLDIGKHLDSKPSEKFEIPIVKCTSKRRIYEEVLRELKKRKNLIDNKVSAVKFTNEQYLEEKLEPAVKFSSLEYELTCEEPVGLCSITNVAVKEGSLDNYVTNDPFEERPGTQPYLRNCGANKLKAKLDFTPLNVRRNIPGIFEENAEKDREKPAELFLKTENISEMKRSEACRETLKDKPNEQAKVLEEIDEDFGVGTLVDAGFQKSDDCESYHLIKFTIEYDPPGP